MQPAAQACCVMPSEASTRATTTSARRMAFSARSTLRASELSTLSATYVAIHKKKNACLKILNDIQGL
jgi:hypothetical protein